MLADARCQAHGYSQPLGQFFDRPWLRQGRPGWYQVWPHIALQRPVSCADAISFKFPGSGRQTSLL